MSRDILHPCLCLCVHAGTCAPLFLGCLPCGEVKQGCQRTSMEKDIAQTPSMFPPYIHHCPADSCAKPTESGRPQHMQACVHVTAVLNSSAGICFWTSPNNVNEGSEGGGIREWWRVIGHAVHKQRRGFDMAEWFNIFLWPHDIFVSLQVAVMRWRVLIELFMAIH